MPLAQSSIYLTLSGTHVVTHVATSSIITLAPCIMLDVLSTSAALTPAACLSCISASHPLCLHVSPSLAPLPLNFSLSGKLLLANQYRHRAPDNLGRKNQANFAFGHELVVTVAVNVTEGSVPGCAVPHFVSLCCSSLYCASLCCASLCCIQGTPCG